MLSTIKVKGIAEAIYNNSDYTLVILKINKQLNSKQAIVKITYEAHLINDLRANIFIGTDV